MLFSNLKIMDGFVCLLAILIGQSLAIDNSKSLLPDTLTCGRQSVDSDNEPRSVAKEKEFPWIALLKYEGDNPFKCVGALINDKYVLTSAVCITSKSHNLTSVVLGAYELGKESHILEYDVEEKIPHKQFKKEKNQYNHDIALLRLNDTVQYSEYVKPVCLVSDSNLSAKPNDIVTLSGWGKSVSGQMITTKKVILRRLISNEECQLAYAKHNITITENHLCTHTLKDHKAFSCAGDGGGPIMFSNKNQWHLEGIVSFGSTCGHDFPDANTYVPKYFNWIIENIRK